MTARNPDNETELPPKPDPTTGEPHPPQAPREWFDFPGEREQDPHQAGAWPRELGPLLECYTPSKKNSTANAGISALLMAGGCTLIFAGFDWVSQWWVWLFIALVAAASYLSIRNSTCSAGAEWFFHNKKWVRQYELSSVKVKMRFSNRYLHLTDQDGRKTATFLGDIQANQRLWDLVYNGIRHSVANAAETNWVARRALELHDLTQ